MTYQHITQAIVSMGSNHDSEVAFGRAVCHLHRLGKVRWSERIVGRDFTGKTDLIYHNACVHIALHEPMSLVRLDERLKAIEYLCGGREQGGLVAMDLDILAVFDHDWQTIARRLPFKAHERAGLLQIAPFLC